MRKAFRKCSLEHVANATFLTYVTQSVKFGTNL